MNDLLYEGRVKQSLDHLTARTCDHRHTGMFRVQPSVNVRIHVRLQDASAKLAFTTYLETAKLPNVYPKQKHPAFELNY